MLVALLCVLGAACSAVPAPASVVVLSPLPSASSPATPGNRIPATSILPTPTPLPDRLCGGLPPLDQVDRPERLLLIDVCRTVTGTVVAQRPRGDGDLLVGLRLDWQFEATLLNLRNMLDEGGNLILDVPCADPAIHVSRCPEHAPGISIPDAGSRIAVTGPFVQDREHGWNAIHPVRSITPTGPNPVEEPIGSREVKRLWAEIRQSWPAIPPMVFAGDSDAGPSAALYPDGLAHVRVNELSPPEPHTVWHEAGHILHASALKSRGALANLFSPADTVGIDYWAARGYPGTWAMHLNSEWRALGYEAFAESFAAVNTGEVERTETYGVQLDRVAMRAFFARLAPPVH